MKLKELKNIFSLKQPDILRHQWMYGGDFGAQSLWCAYKTVPDKMRLCSFHSYFISPGLSKPLFFEVERVRDTKNRAWRRVSVKQQEKIIYHSEFMFKEVSFIRFEKIVLRFLEVYLKLIKVSI